MKNEKPDVIISTRLDKEQLASLKADWIFGPGLRRPSLRFRLSPEDDG